MRSSLTTASGTHLRNAHWRNRCSDYLALTPSRLFIGQGDNRHLAGIGSAPSESSKRPRWRAHFRSEDLKSHAARPANRRFSRTYPLAGTPLMGRARIEPATLGLKVLRLRAVFLA